MSKKVRRSVLMLLLLALASIVAIPTRSASGCPADYEGTWNGGDYSCRGAARDCAVVNVCSGPMPV
ncbi:MAG: hypothetical protein ACJ75H_13275 [Thermoanaerobaculia bacterium]